MVWAVPKQLQGGKYTLESVLGQGRFGITYLAGDRKGDRIVVKTLDNQLLNQPDFKRLQERFVQEAFKLAKCKHPHIVRLLEDPFQEDDLWCIAMEYIAGIDLAHRPQNILPEADALQYIQQIGEALTVVHQNNLVHRDVKPANIMIRAGSKEAVLIDFGLARGIDSKKLSVSNLETEAEAGFTPPELYSHTIELGAYTDVYSLAGTLYNLLTGQIPTSAKERLQNHTPLPEPKYLNPQISDNINRDILWAMDLDPKKRPQSIQAWLDSLGLKPTPVVNPNEPEPRRINYELWLTIIGLILAVIAIFTGIFQQDIREIFIKPSSSPTEKSTPTPLPTKPPN
ncbi:MAG: serine/threonine protein kinase [Nostoc sp. ZfuVER08]|nr:serine/threonine-protein kinase [Nostoc sp. ZfuVER08]